MPKPDPAKERYWRAVVADSAAAGVSRAKYCREHGISDTQLRNWICRLKERDAVAVTAKTGKREQRSMNAGTPHGTAKLLTRSEAAEYLGIAEQTLAIWGSTGRYGLPMVKVGRFARYRREDLDAFLSKRTRNPDQSSALGSRVMGRGESSVTEKSKGPERAQRAVEFAEVQLVDHKSRQESEGQKSDTTMTLEIILAGGTTLRLTANCSLDLLSSVITMLENR